MSDPIDVFDESGNRVAVLVDDGGEPTIRNVSDRAIEKGERLSWVAPTAPSAERTNDA